MLCFAQATQKKTLQSLGSVWENGFQAPTARFQPAPFRPRVIALFDKGASGSYIQVMRSVGLKTLKNKLSEYVRLAAGGETVLVTDRDRVVAEIGPPGPSRTPMLSDALLLNAFRQGWMTPPISVGKGPPERKPVMTIDELLSNLQRDRADR
jgi:antitoxin (DNA-binding transcriptional repressor) of toxin-antitoxin stability system